MYLIAIAWIYVVLMMVVAEATSPNGSLLGALFTALLYGALPLAIVMYVFGTPARRRARAQAEADADADARARERDTAARAHTESHLGQTPHDTPPSSAPEPDAGGESTGGASIPAERKEA